MTYEIHIENLVKKLKVRLSFYYQNTACLNLAVRLTVRLTVVQPRRQHACVELTIGTFFTCVLPLLHFAA